MCYLLVSFNDSGFTKQFLQFCTRRHLCLLLNLRSHFTLPPPPTKTLSTSLLTIAIIIYLGPLSHLLPFFHSKIPKKSNFKIITKRVRKLGKFSKLMSTTLNSVLENYDTIVLSKKG